MGWRERISRLPRRVEALHGEIAKLIDTDPLPAHEIAPELDDTFAKEVLMAAWSSSMTDADEPEDRLRPAFKRALIAAQEHPSGRSRSIRKLAQLVVSCVAEQEEQAESITPLWASSTPDRFINLVITGQDLQSTPFAEELVSHFDESTAFAARASISGVGSSHTSPLVTEFAARLRMRPDISEFWRGILLRLLMAYRASEQSLSHRIATRDSGHAPILCHLPDTLYIQSTFGDHLSDSLDIYADDLRSELCFAGTDRTDDVDLVTNPVLEVSDGFITSPYLILDSLSPFILKWLGEHGAWTEAITRPFEEKVISLLRETGLIAGTVHKSGFWETDTERTPLHEQLHESRSTCPGEMDAVAFDGSVMLLFECKSVYPFAKVRNLAGKVSDEDVEGWFGNARRKAQWLAEATGLPVGFTAIVVEGVRYFDSDAADRCVPVIDFATLQELMTAVDEEHLL
ncbi:hypothetical protein GCM10009823_15820 [Brevibacterium salitolerans]|uniref:Uncharacterized protein n=1 Tax=Brevibacterium salitolerans TaxID=1403566 RepID=A0ABN2WN60_9MICO